MSTIQRAYKTELDLNNEQSHRLQAACGRGALGVQLGTGAQAGSYRATGKSPSAMELHRDLNALKQTDVPWMYEVSKCAPQEALRNLDNAFAHFFRRVKLKKAGETARQGGLSPAQDQQARAGQLPPHRHALSSSPTPFSCHGWGGCGSKNAAICPPAAKILSATVSEQAGHWYVSVLVEQEQTVPTNTGRWWGWTWASRRWPPSPMARSSPIHAICKRRLKKLKRLQRAVSRKQQRQPQSQEGGAATRASCIAAWPTSAPTRCIRSPRLAKTKSVVVIEDLNVAGMLKNHHLAQAIGDVGFAEFRRQLIYKAAWYGCQVLVASRWEPSSKTCSGVWLGGRGPDVWQTACSTVSSAARCSTAI